MNNHQKQQSLFMQVFCIMFQSYLDRYSQMLLKNQNSQVDNLELGMMKFMLKSHLHAYNALPDKDKSVLYGNNKKLIDELHIEEG